jgi:hypothetical protein
MWTMTNFSLGVLHRKRKRPAPRFISTLEWEKNNVKEEPFVVLFSKVGLTLFVACAGVYFVSVSLFQINSLNLDIPRTKESINNDDNLRNAIPDYALMSEEILSSTPDAFWIASTYPFHEKTESSSSGSSTVKFLRLAQNLRSEFATRYGGEPAARAMLHRGIQIVTKKTPEDSETSAYNSAMSALSKRLLVAAESRQAFRMDILGSSAAAGYGNRADQSYSMIVEGLLGEAMESLGMDWNVRNLARESTKGVFPLTWCVRDDGVRSIVDIVAYDFPNVQGIEAFIRNQAGGAQVPIMMFRGALQDQQRSMLQK